MTPVMTGSSPSRSAPPQIPWFTFFWVGAFLLAAYAQMLARLVSQWYNDPDMGHGFFVPLVAGYIAWQKFTNSENPEPETNWWGLVLVVWAALQLYIGALGAELFLQRTSFVISLIGVVLLVGGTKYVKKFAFPLFLLFFMIPIPTVLYNQLTFPLQMRASEMAEWMISALGIPVIREGNVLELANQKLNVVEACSGIRSLLTLTFLSLVYGYFGEKRKWIRAALFFSTIPIAILANAGRVALTGVVSQINPELAEGLFHEAQGWVIFMVAFAILAVTHQIFRRIAAFSERRTEASA
ncbi:MAG: exosortase [Acidobacteriota bacterium]|nr:exosortase [Acidobacteriota bacterium]